MGYFEFIVAVLHREGRHIAFPTAEEAPENLAESLSLTLTADDLAGGALRIRGFWNRTADIYGGGTFADFQDPAIAPLGTLFDQSQNISRKWGVNASWERGFGPLNLVAGVDLLNDRTVQVLVQTGRAWVPPTDYRSIAPFGQANLALWDGKLRLAGGEYLLTDRVDDEILITCAIHSAPIDEWMNR